MLYRINGKRLFKRGIYLDKENIPKLIRKIKETVQQKGNCLVCITGSPGSGKSRIANFVKKNGFFSIPQKELLVIDDLRGPNGEQYQKRDLRMIVKTLRGIVILLFDFRAARYLRRADMGIMLRVDEEKRLQNLMNRSNRGYRRYKKKFYRIPPVPFTFNKGNFYICSEGLLTGY